MIFLGGLVLVAGAVMVLIEAAFTPWARSLTGGETLTGEWTGEFRTATGRTHRVWLDLVHPFPSSRCADCPSIDGSIRTCDGSGVIRDFEIWGDVENWRGTVFYIKTRESVERPGQLALGILQGTWGGDSIELTANLYVPGAPTTTSWERDEAGNEKYSVIGGHPDAASPVTWRMRRGTEREFAARCGKS